MREHFIFGGERQFHSFTHSRLSARLFAISTVQWATTSNTIFFPNFNVIDTEAKCTTLNEEATHFPAIAIGIRNIYEPNSVQ